MELIGGRLLVDHLRRVTVCIHEKHWTDEAMLRDIEEKNPDVCWECLHVVSEMRYG